MTVRAPKCPDQVAVVSAHLVLGCRLLRQSARLAIIDSVRGLGRQQPLRVHREAAHTRATEPELAK